MGFERCHPGINFIYFAAVIAGTVLFRHPVFVAVSVLCAFLYTWKRNGKKGAVLSAALLPLAGGLALWYASFHHFGVTVLQRNFIGNNMTLEALVYGMVLGFVVAGVTAWASCVFSVITTDKVVYLFGRISPRLSLFLAILLRMVPRIKKQAKKLNTAQRGIGRGAGQGNFFRRFHNCIRIFSMLVTWTIESLTTVSESMNSRGSSLRGRKAFSIYRFDHRDRALVLVLFACLTLCMMGYMLEQTTMLYDPRLILPPVTAMTFVFCAGYAALCLLPLLLELWTEYRFQKARQ